MNLILISYNLFIRTLKYLIFLCIVFVVIELYFCIFKSENELLSCLLTYSLTCLLAYLLTGIYQV